MGFSEEQVVHVRRGSLLHDIGKMAIPDEILHKKGKLTEEEWAIMREHPKHAYQWLQSVGYLKEALDIPYCHHERWDGSGYPRGLKGAEIPLIARLFAIVDVWDALRSDRPYRKAMSLEETMKLILEGSGTHFDPNVVDNFCKFLEEEKIDLIYAEMQAL
jgi:HD-GYP domain-containing protein (c-di-GMP phosphodiesterase class II)